MDTVLPNRPNFPSSQLLNATAVFEVDSNYGDDITKVPTSSPTPEPSRPSQAPTPVPTETSNPSEKPSPAPTPLPTTTPEPSQHPSLVPTAPTSVPTLSNSPTFAPTPQRPSVFVALSALYHSTNGADWTAKHGWMNGTVPVEIQHGQ